MSSKASVVPVSLPVPVLTFLKWLELTQGRDKLLRFIAYFSKWVIQTLKNNNLSPDLAVRLAKGASTIGLTRKVLRFFRSLEYVQEFLKSVQIKDEVEKYISLFKAFSLFVWMICDHSQWLHKAGYLNLSDKLKRIDEIHSKAWFWGLLSGLVLSLYKLKKVLDESRQAQEQLRLLSSSDSKEQSDKVSQSLKSLDDKKAKQVQSIVKNSIDCLIPCARLNWLPLSDGAVGLAGSITSVIGILDTWPKKL